MKTLQFVHSFHHPRAPQVDLHHRPVRKSFILFQDVKTAFTLQGDLLSSASVQIVEEMTCFLPKVLAQFEFFVTFSVTYCSFVFAGPSVHVVKNV
jgi:hypothetical protein